MVVGEYIVKESGLDFRHGDPEKPVTSEAFLTEFR